MTSSEQSWRKHKKHKKHGQPLKQCKDFSKLLKLETIQVSELPAMDAIETVGAGESLLGKPWVMAQGVFTQSLRRLMTRSPKLWFKMRGKNLISPTLAKPMMGCRSPSNVMVVSCSLLVILSWRIKKMESKTSSSITWTSFGPKSMRV